VDYITPGIRLLAPEKRGIKKRGFAMTPGKYRHAAGAPLRSNPAEFPTATPGDLSTCDHSVTPDCIRALYQVPLVPEYPGGTPRSDNSMGIFEEGDYYAQEDLDLFFANYTPHIPQGTHPTPAFIDGAAAPTDVADAGGESDLDFELAYPLLYPQTITLFQTDDLYYATNENSTSTGGFNTFLDALDGVSGAQSMIVNLS
jgi:tripeptidyl-peptidase I